MAPYVFVAAGLLLLGPALTEPRAAQHAGPDYVAATASGTTGEPREVRYAGGR